MAERTLADRVHDTIANHTILRDGHPTSIGKVAGPVALREVTEAVMAEMQPVVDERDRLRELTATCSCGTTPMTYEGPEADCPVHGAVRALNDATRRLQAVRDAIDAHRSSKGPAATVPVYRLAAALGGEDPT